MKSSGVSIIAKLYQILFCLVGLANFGLVLFDGAYLWKIPYTRLTTRDLCLVYAPKIAKFYDPIKGIEPHRFSAGYISNADSAFSLIADGKDRDAQKFLDDLIADSKEVIDQKPGFSHFSIAEKDGTLQILKNKMRSHFKTDSAKDAFVKFWSRENLSPDRVKTEREFFDKEIKVLLNQNYFRWIDEDGEIRDYFYKIDAWFVLFFITDFLGRWLIAILRKRHRKWYLFPVRNAADIFMLFPPHHSVIFRLCRIIPLYFRMKNAGLIPGQSILPEIIHDNAGLIAEEISGMVLVNILEQSAKILEQKNAAAMIDPKAVSAVKDLVDTQLERIVDTVIPDVEPQITKLVIHSVYQAMGPYLRTPLGPALRLGLYGVEASIKDGLKAALTGEEGREQMKEILRMFVREGMSELTAGDNVSILQKQSAALLSEIRREVLRSIQESRA